MIGPVDLAAAVLDRLYQMSEQTQHFFHPSSVERLAGGELAPVLILPGVYETWQFLQPVAVRLHALGHPIHVLTDLGYNRKTIQASAAIAQRYIHVHDLSGVIIVAHSKGGLVGKHMMVADDREGRIAQLIAVNSPFVGSTLARYAPVKTLRAFSPTDETVLTLAANLAANHRITSIYSRLDPLIPAGSELVGATNVELSMVGHFRPLSSPQLFEAIERAIEVRR